jgi:hypothetical protein
MSASEVDHLSTAQIEQGSCKLGGSCEIEWWLDGQDDEATRIGVGTIMYYPMSSSVCVNFDHNECVDACVTEFRTITRPVDTRCRDIQFTYSELIAIIQLAIDSYNDDDVLEGKRKLTILKQHYIDKLEAWAKPRDEAMLAQVGPFLEPQFGRDAGGIVADLLMDGTLAVNTVAKYPAPASSSNSSGMRLAL